jgi:CCR4-NOT transcriptional complex subunit CAF120
MQPGAARQNVWSQALERDPTAANPEPNGRDTFIQMEPPSQTMTKAFAPHGLLSVGLQDKQDRSAKRQEELARETGASLINVQNKPPPPQTGLLGAVTAHERERKREGGLGATLTERERERRLAEERQRKLDELQRMQLDQMQQAGSMYGMPQQLTGFNPMMMMGMNPMMTGGWGFPGMMNPQHMFAAQQAAQAYQQAMAAFSTPGSQVGEGGMPQMNPMNSMNPMMTGGMPFDPRMSMVGMPMMSPSMTGMAGMSPGLGMGGMGPMGMGGMGMGMSPQMTGGSAYGFAPVNDGGLRAPSEAGASRPYSQNSSAHGQGSPAVNARPLDGGEETGKKLGADIR